MLVDALGSVCDRFTCLRCKSPVIVHEQHHAHLMVQIAVSICTLLNVDASWVLQAVQAVLADGPDSMFTQQMLNPTILNSSVDAIAYASNFQPFAGDSFAEQVADYVVAKTGTDKVPLGVSVGVSVVGAAILAVTAALAFHVLRHKRQNRQQKVTKHAHSSYLFHVIVYDSLP